MAQITFTTEALGAACGAITLLGGLATAYLRLAMGKALHEMRDSMVDQMRANFVFKEAHRPEMHDIKKAIVRNEAHIEKLTDRVDGLEIRVAKIAPDP